MRFSKIIFYFLGLALLTHCGTDDEPEGPAPNPGSQDTTTYSLGLISVKADSTNFMSAGRIYGIDRNFPATIKFSRAVDSTSITNSSLRVSAPGTSADIDWFLSDSGKTINVLATEPLDHIQRYTLHITSAVTGAEGEIFEGYSREFYTEVDTTPKFPVVSDEELLTLVQEQTLKYFLDIAHPVSGLARERNTSGETVTIGGSGFGVMCILVGIERGFISRSEGVDRLNTIVDFLAEADRFHGVWPHWINGTTGEVQPFSANDDGADLVETSFMIQGLLTVREYLDEGNTEESELIDKINTLWEAVEWDWFTQGQDVLYWHWSPNSGFSMNMQISGYNEALITYFLAAASPTHPIDAEVYHNGWAHNGNITNGNSYYNYILPVGNYGSPLFFAHYSFLGLDPNNLQDQYADYWMQNVNHTLINRAYSIDNPQNYVGYSENSWGLTASDNPEGYSAHSPTNDLGVITPTAALSSMPYTPEESMEALHFFYYTIGDKLWGEYGFYDAFDFTAGWVANSYLAIDQGPIIIMIENHRTGLLWNNFMTAPEVNAAMEALGFSN